MNIGQCWALPRTGKLLNSPIKSTSSEEFYEIHNIVLDSISKNIASLVQTLKYGAINTKKTKAMGYYVIKYVSDTFKLQ